MTSGDPAKTVSATTRALVPVSGRGGLLPTQEFRHLLAEDQIVKHSYYNQELLAPTFRGEPSPGSGPHGGAGHRHYGATNIKAAVPYSQHHFCCRPLVQGWASAAGRGTEDERPACSAAMNETDERGWPKKDQFDRNLMNHDVDECAAGLYAMMRTLAGLDSQGAM